MRVGGVAVVVEGGWWCGLGIAPFSHEYKMKLPLFAIIAHFLSKYILSVALQFRKIDNSLSLSLSLLFRFLEGNEKLLLHL